MMITQLLQKHWKEDRKELCLARERKKTHTIFIAGVDIKAAFDAVGPEAYGKTTLSPGHTWVDYKEAFDVSTTRSLMNRST